MQPGRPLISALPGVFSGRMPLNERHWRQLLFGLLIVALAVILATFLDYGLTWDESLQSAYADSVLRWFRTRGQDRHALGSYNLHLYGGAFEVPAQLAGRILPFGLYEGRHLMTALVGFGAVIAAWLLGCQLAGPRAAFVAAVFVLATAPFYGHLFNNSKDVPFATFSTLVLVAMFAAAERVPRIPWKYAIITGVALGLTLGVRVGGIFHLGYILLAWFGALVLHHRRSGASFRVAASDGVRMALQVGAVVVIAWGLMLVLWPFGQVSPIANPLRALNAASRFGWDGSMLFAGAEVRSTALPWTYVPHYFAVTLSEAQLFALLLGVIAATVSLRRRAFKAQTLFRLGMLVFMVSFPVVAAIALRSTLYDGIRHFLFLVPLLAVLAGWGFSAFLDIASRGTVLVASALVAAGVVFVVVEYVQLHPYQYVRFNQLVGGLPGAYERYETDYWGLSYRESAEWLALDSRATPYRPLSVSNCSLQILHAYFLEKDDHDRRRYTTVSKDSSSDIFLATTRYGCHRRTDPVIHVVRRQGVPLTYIFAMDPPRPPK